MAACRYIPRVLLTAGVISQLSAATALTLAAHAGLGPISLEIGFLASLSSLGLVMPNAIALALDGHGTRAGSAAAWLGALQFGAAAAASSLVAALADGTATPAAATMLAAAAVACLSLLRLRRRSSFHGAAHQSRHVVALQQQIDDNTGHD